MCYKTICWLLNLRKDSHYLVYTQEYKAQQYKLMYMMYDELEEDEAPNVVIKTIHLFTNMFLNWQ